MAFDATAFRGFLAGRGIVAVIPTHPTRAGRYPFDRHLYKERHLVECFINKIKHFRRIAPRYDKTTHAFLSMICIAAMMVWLR
jgi:transposase